MLSGFQTVENQRVERNIRSLQFALEDKHKQLEAKLADWAIWDDSYVFMTNRNQAYIDSNLTQESFIKTGVDEALFIDKNNALLASISVLNNEKGTPQDVYDYFATGSALMRINKKEGHKSGLLKTNNGILLFSVGEVLKSDETGPPNGYIVFGTYLDTRLLTVMKDLTQFNTKLVKWDDTTIPSDYIEMKSMYKKRIKQNIKKLDQNTIGGYLVLEDAFEKPLGILRIDVVRDITQQGKAAMLTLMVVLIISGILGAVLNNWLLTGVVLKGIFNISAEIKDLGKTKSLGKRMLVVESEKDELGILRVNINNMLADIERSQMSLKIEMGKQESLLELIDIVVVMLDKNACITQINKKGCNILGYTEKELIGMNWIENIIAQEDHGLMKKKFEEIINSNIVNNDYFENSLITKDKKIVTIGWHNTVIKDSNGAIVSTLSVGEDITEKKKEELAKEDYTNTLKRLNEIMVGRELKMIELKEKLKHYET
jgi:PAS domain S-box-containing protein